MNSPPLRIGILGTANIARAFVTGVAAAMEIRMAAIASRDHEAAAQFAREFGIETSFGSYEALLGSCDIDAVYIPLPNSMHAEWAIRAIEAGKHVLCEKPLATSASDARRMFSAADRRGVVLREAFPYLAQPQTIRTRELIGQGAVGKIQLIRASFGLAFSDKSNIRFNPALGGGSLLDAGSYCRILAQSRAKRVQAVARWTDDALDRTLVATIDFASGVLAQISCSFATAFHRQALIAGDDGVIETDFTNHAWSSGRPIVRLRRGVGFRTPFEVIEVPGTDGFLAETLEFKTLIESKKGWNGATADESVDISKMLDAMLQSARGDGCWVDIPPNQMPEVEEAAAGK
jgi:D-xylose 1-dehydrogenase (NADP+, D-xylono-1,5-lactone-forming)